MAVFERRLRFHQRAIAQDAAQANFVQLKVILDKMFKQKKIGLGPPRYKREQNHLRKTNLHPPKEGSMFHPLLTNDEYLLALLEPSLIVPDGTLLSMFGQRFQDTLESSQWLHDP